MPQFSYKAYDGRGEWVNGTLTADTPASGRHSLRQLGFRLVEFLPTQTDRQRAIIGRTTKRQEEVAEAARQIAMLLRAGVPLVEALDVLIQQQKGRLQVVLQDVRERISSGASFGQALEAYPNWFDGLFRTAARIGQASGQMDASLDELAAFMQEQLSVKTKLTNALVYPIILVVLGIAVTLFLMSYVIPQLLHVLEISGRRLPISTAALKWISDFLLQYWIILGAGTGLTVLAGVALYRWPIGRYWCHRSELVLPLLGTLIRKSIIARFAQSLTLLLKTGVPFLDALKLVRENCRNEVFRVELDEMERSVQRGSDLAPAIAESRIFPPLVVHMVNVGQKSGALPDMLRQLKEGYDNEIRLAIGRFSAILEPVLIVVMSVVVGFIVFATVMPILEVTRTLQP